ncbi:MAG: hypothetical protein M3R11_12940 [Acidobacteriota bacterium]|nr:hypothetical protein [Acidobacteriota bacterium]
MLSQFSTLLRRRETGGESERLKLRFLRGTKLDCSTWKKSAAKKSANLQTVTGFVLYRSGRIPAAAESFDWNKLRFEIADMDDGRIDKSLIERRGENSRVLKKGTRFFTKSRPPQVE